MPEESAPTTSESSRAPDSVRRMDHGSIGHAKRQAGFWALMFGSGESSFGLLGAFLKAPPEFFALLAGIPQLAAPVFQVLSANLLERFPHRKRIVLGSVLGHVAALAPIALLALLPPGWLAYGLLLGAIALYYVSGHFGQPAWTSMMSDIVPSSRRGVIFAQFGRIGAALTLVSMLATAGVLAWAERHDPANKAWYFCGIFVFAASSRFICFLCITRMQEPHYEPRPERAFTFWQFIRRARESNFVKFVLFAALMNGTANIAGPFFLPYCRYDLQMQDWQWIVINGSATAATILALPLWGRFADRFGNKRTITYSSLIIALQPLWWLTSTDFWILTAINLLSGVGWAGFNLACANYIMEACSPPVRARCVAYYTILLGAGVFSGSMFGAYLMRAVPADTPVLGVLPAAHYPFQYVLVASAALRLASALAFVPLFKELREVSHFNFKDWFFESVQSRFSGGLRLIPFTVPDDEDENTNKPGDKPAKK
jgi:MFS family permease